MEEEKKAEKKVILTPQNTFVPIGIMVLVATAVFFFTTIVNKVEAQERKDSPSREEFNRICTDITEIKGDIKTLIKQGK